MSVDKACADAVLDYNDRMVEAYESNLEDAADVGSPAAVSWSDDERKVEMRFESLLEIGDLSGCSVLDFGCGVGLFRDFLDERGVECEYHGWDVSDRMVSVARSRHPDARFERVDVLADDDYPRDEFDYVLASGVFNYVLDESVHADWVRQVLRRIWPLCDVALGVNFFTEFVDYRNDVNFYPDVDDVVQYLVENCSRWFRLHHAYELYEYAAFVYRDPPIEY